MQIFLGLTVFNKIRYNIQNFILISNKPWSQSLRCFYVPYRVYISVICRVIYLVSADD
jgi:hypothetical protein